LITLRLAPLFLQIDQLGHFGPREDPMTPASTDLLESERFNQSNEIDERHISDVTSKDASEEPTWSHDCDRIQRVSLRISPL
jgi:hypothetical protein